MPLPLPPEPPISWSTRLLDRLEGANRAIGRLDGIANMLPGTSLFLYQYVRKEALLSSQIEGTQSSFSDLLLYEMEEIPGVPLDDVEEVSRYVEAVHHGLDLLRAGFPVSLRWIREIHGVLLTSGRGSDKSPGDFRKSQNWIGGTRPGDALFVPPPPERVVECMGELEKFLHDTPSRTPAVVKAALAHVQFETIHPFLDGKGRDGRLLVTLLLCAEKALAEPILYLSLYLKSRRDEYYDLLQRVREQGDWESWLDFFLAGVDETAGQAVLAAKRILDLFRQDRERISELGRAAGSARRVHEMLQRQPIVAIRQAARALGLSAPTVSAALDRLSELDVVREATGKRRDRLFVYGRYVALLAEGTEPLR